TAVASTAVFAPPRRRAAARTDDPHSGWRPFGIETRIDVLRPEGPTRVWVPTPLTVATPYQVALGNTFHADGGTVSFTDNRDFATGIVAAEWPEGSAPRLVVTSRVRTRDYAVDLATAPATAPPADRAELTRFLEPTPLVPTDGIVKETAAQITRGATTDRDRARAIY